MIQNKNIEQIFKKLEGTEVTPSPRLIEKTMKATRRRLFYRFKPTRFNVYYLASILIVASIIGVSVNKNTDATNIQTQDSTIQNIESASPKKNQISEIDVTPDSISKAPSSESKTNININSSIHKPSLIDSSETKSIKSKPETTITIANRQAIETPSLPATPYFTPSLFSGCAPLKVTFINNSINANKHKWILANGTIISNQNEIEEIYTEAGTYMVTLQVTGEDKITLSHTETIKVLPSPVADFTIQDEIIYNNSIDATNFQWKLNNIESEIINSDFQPDYRDIQKLIKPNSSAKLILISSNANGCYDTAMVSISQERENTLIFPNAFSPNPNGGGGGYYTNNEADNSVFHPIYKEAPLEYKLTIFNKNGEQIFFSEDIQIGWDGYYKEVASPNGVYIYICSGRWPDGSIYNYRGDITIIPQKNK